MFELQNCDFLRHVYGTNYSCLPTSRSENKVQFQESLKMTDSTQSTGRARGRARGKPMTEEEARASLRKPGEYPAHIQPPPQQSASGKGRRNRAPEFLIRTKSDQLTTKKGLGGTVVKLTSNYFPLIANPTWKLLQYCVDIQPDINMTKAC